jgi:sRNA-binding regulator protein Hfq
MKDMTMPARDEVISDMAFLNALRGKDVDVELRNGTQHSGTLTAVFPEGVVVEIFGKSILIYKHAINTVQESSGPEYRPG